MGRARRERRIYVRRNPACLAPTVHPRRPCTRDVMHDLIRHVHRIEGSTIVFVTHDVEEAIYLGQRIVLMAPRPGRIDTLYDVPLPAERHQDMKLAPEFLALKREILERIRETSGMKTDLEQLARLNADSDAALTTD